MTTINSSIPATPTTNVVEEHVHVETECGWKGKLRRSETTETARTRSPTDSTFSEDSDMNQVYKVNLGSEPNMFEIDVETKGVQQIIKALTENEIQQMEQFDTTMPIRHFRAEKGNTDKAITQIKETLQWRKEFGVDILVNCFSVENTDQDTPEHAEMRKIMAIENATGKIYVRNADNEGRVFMYMTPARENTNHDLINNMRHLVWNLEKAIACTRANANKYEKINLLIDYGEHWNLGKAPPMATTKYTLDILQNHYPEFMKHAYLLHPPMVFKFFWSLIKTFVDPITKEKIVFLSKKHHEKLTDTVNGLDKLETRAYGTIESSTTDKFDSNQYLHLPFPQPLE